MRFPLMDPAFVERALASIRPVAYRDAFVALTSRCAPQAFERLASSDMLGERTIWDPRGVAEDLGPAMAGAGVALREINGGGTPRLSGLVPRAAAVFRGLIEFRDDGCEDAPPPAFMGGASFAPKIPTDVEWGWFGDDMFVLPRWRAALTSSGAFSTWVFTVEELADRAALLRELSTANDVIMRSPTMRIYSTNVRVREDLSRERWRALVEKAIQAVSGSAANSLRKLVPARRTHIEFESTIDPVACVARAGAKFRSCTRFMVEREERAFVGATPERLIRVKGREIETDALAGSLPRAADSVVDALSRELLASDKNRREHEAVVAAIRAALATVCESMDVPSAPTVRALPNLVHLWTPIRATLRSTLHPLDLVGLLHPTPAVAGTPRELAVQWLVRNEPHPRGWFTGPVGWFDARGDGAFVVGLRSMLLYRNHAWLYAGAGVVAGSDPDAEYEETSAKLTAMTAALGL
ncbi:MAG: isochorismate synthase [Myxococcales bacterium]|nr:isochorismate synthase [Myxococcales bacterium]